MRRLLVPLLAASLLGALAAPALAQTSIGIRRLGVGATPTMPDGSSVRLQGLLTSGGTDFVLLDAEGDAIRRSLATGDIPGLFTRRDLPESISGLWQFNAGLTALATSSFTSATFSGTIGVTGVATLTGGYAAGASSSIAGNLTLGGTGRRVVADFSNATIANRAAFQTSTTNSPTHLQALPSGTSTTSSFVAANTATPTNAGLAQLLVTSTEASLRADRFGSGSYLPLTFFAGGAERFRWAIDGTGVVQPSSTLRTDHYASGTTGWALTGDGDFDTRRATVGELQAKSYIADLEQALNGGQIMSKSNAFVAQPFTCPAPSLAGTLWVRDYPSAADMRVFASGDWVVLRIHTRADSDADGNLEMTIADCVGVVTGYADQVDGVQTWTFTRAAAPNGGSASTGAVVPVETIALDFGTANAGLIETTVLDGAEGINSPYLQVFTWATSPIVSNRTVRTRLGKLTGLTGTANEFGLLAGAYAATDGRYLRASNSAFELHGVDLTIWDGSTQAFLMRRNSGAPYFSIGNPAPTTFGSGVGFWAGDDGGTYKFRIGNPAGNRLAYDSGTGVLTVAGEGSGVTNINGGNIQADSISADKLNINAQRIGEDSLNFLINGTFEQGYTSSASIPAQWVVGSGTTANIFTDGSTFKHGIRSTQITGTGDYYVYQDVYLWAGTYTLSSWIRTAGKTVGSAVVNLDALGGTAYSLIKIENCDLIGDIADVGLPPASSTQDFTNCVVRFKVTTPGGMRVYLQKGYGTSANGQAWFDSVVLQRDAAIVASDISVGSLSAITATLGAVSAGSITSSTISSSTVSSAGNWELSTANGLTFQPAADPFGDLTRGVNFSGGGAIYQFAGMLRLQDSDGPGSDVVVGRYNSARQFMEGTNVTNGPNVFWTLTDGTGTVFTPLQLRTAGLLTTNVLPSLDSTHQIGAPFARYTNINLNLPNNPAASYVVVNKGGGGDDANSALGYITGVTGTVTRRNAAGTGTCTDTYVSGVLTATTC